MNKSAIIKHSLLLKIHDMKKLLIPLLLLAFSMSYGQTNYYTKNNGILLNEKEVKVLFEKSLKTLPPKFSLTPTIYHKIVKNDSIINYLAFHARRSDSIINNNKFEFVFEQDPLFLLLNKKLPEFKLKDINGIEFSSSQLIGKPALLNYWAIYCPPCVAEIPDLNKLKEKYDDKMNFVALTENTCQRNDLKKFLETHPFNFTMLQDAEYYKEEIKIGPIPRNLFIDKEGYIRYIQGNYPFENDKAVDINDESNYFVRIIDELIERQQLVTQ